MKIIVTGAAGAIGSHLCERLLDLGHEVVGIDSFTSYYDPNIKKINALDLEKKGILIKHLDLAKDDIDSVIKDVDVIFHLAAQPGISATVPFENYLKNNVTATYRLLESAKKNTNLQLFVFASTSSVYGVRANGDETTEPKPTSHYGVTKLAAEQLAMSYYRELGLPVTAFRFFSVYGERERPEKFYHRLIKAIAEGKEMPFYQGSEYHKRSYTYVSDIIDGCILALQNVSKVTGEIFNLGNDKSETTGEGLALVEEIMGKKAMLKILSRRRGDQFETSADISKARKIFGYNPKVGLKEGLAAEVRWYMEKINNKIN